MSLKSGTVFLLSANRHLRSRLALYLRELGREVRSLHSLTDLLQTPFEDLTKIILLIDAEMASRDLDRDSLESPSEGKTLRVVGVVDEETVEETHDKNLWKSCGVETVLYLSTHPGRAKERLDMALGGKLHKKAFSRQGTTKSQLSGLRRLQSRFSPVRKQPIIRRPEKPATPDKCRYLFDHSSAGKEFFRKLRDLPSATPLVVVSGVTGAEFELVARELQHLRFGEAHGPFLPLPEEITMDNLVSWEKKYEKSAQSGVCYAGVVDELPHDKVQVLKEFVEFLLSLRNPSLTLMVGWERDHEFRNIEQATLFKEWNKHCVLTLPALAERREDIRALANSLISQLRVLHPFLVCRSFDESGYVFLEEQARDHSWEGICSLIRSAAATTNSPRLGARELEPFRDPSVLGAHIIESKADEVYFP